MSDLTDFLSALGTGVQRGGQAGFGAAQLQSQQQQQAVANMMAMMAQQSRAEQNAILNQFTQQQIIEKGRANIAREDIQQQGLGLRERFGLADIDIKKDRLSELIRSNLFGEEMRGQEFGLKKTVGLGGLEVRQGQLAETERANVARETQAVQRTANRLGFDIFKFGQEQSGLNELLGLPPTPAFQPQFTPQGGQPQFVPQTRVNSADTLPAVSLGAVQRGDIRVSEGDMVQDIVAASQKAGRKLSVIQLKRLQTDYPYLDWEKIMPQIGGVLQ